MKLARSVVVMVVVVCLLLAVDVSEGGRRRKKNQPFEVNWKCNKGGTTFKVRARQLFKNTNMAYFPVRCDDDTTTGDDITTSVNDNDQTGMENSASSGSRGLIAELNVVGRFKNCRGVTPDLLVQMNKCHWQESCNIAYYKVKANYMVKVMPRSSSDTRCVARKPKNIRVSYSCLKPNVPLLTLSAKKEPSPTEQSSSPTTTDKTTPTEQSSSPRTQEVTASQGVIRSHEYQPWLYDGDVIKSGDSLVLNRPSASTTVFRYTIRTLAIAPDTLNLSWGEQTSFSSRIYRDDDINDETGKRDVTDRSGVIENANRVTLEIQTSQDSLGGEGFLVCFKWLQKDDVADVDACSGLLQRRLCTQPNTRERRNRT